MNLLEKRIRSLRGYELVETLDAINEDYEILDSAARALKYGGWVASSALKGTILSLPMVDAIAGSIYITSGVLKFRKLANGVIEYLDIPEQFGMQERELGYRGAEQKEEHVLRDHQNLCSSRYDLNFLFFSFYLILLILLIL